MPIRKEKGMKKKILALLMSAAMAVSLLAGCGGTASTGTADEKAAPVEQDAEAKAEADDSNAETEAAAGSSEVEKSDYTVQVYIPTPADTTDAPMVSEAINEIMYERYGVKINLNYIVLYSYEQQQSLLLTGSDADIMVYMAGIAPFVSRKQILDLTDYVANASDEFKNKFTEEQWKSCQLEGRQYAIPNLRNYFGRQVMWFDTEKLETLDVDVSQIKTLADVGEVLYKAHEKYPEIYTIVPQMGSLLGDGYAWDETIGSLGNYGQDTEFKDIFEVPDFVDFCKQIRQWNVDGLCMGDALSNQEMGINMIQAGTAFSCLSGRSIEVPPEGVTEVTMVDFWIPGANLYSFTYGINSLSEHPEEAFRALEALYIDSDIQNILVNGIKDVHYVDNGDGTCSYPEGVTSSTSTYGVGVQSWTLPFENGDVLVNTMLGGSDYYARVKELNDTAPHSKMAGLVLDLDKMGIKDEYAACSAVVDKYYYGLLNGVLDPETTLPLAHQEMVDNGIDKILEAKQKALDELLKSE